MKPVTVAILSAMALFMAAFGGYALCHQRSVIAFQQSEAARVAANRRTDSVNRALQDTILRSHSMASSDSVLQLALTLRAALAQQSSDSAKTVAKIATERLDSAQSQLDSVRIYRSELVPALRDEIAGLHSIVAVKDSTLTLAADWGEQQRKAAAAFRQMRDVDSMQIQVDSVALAKAVKAALPAPGRPWWKPRACVFGGVNLIGHATAGIGACYVL